ncbi:Flp pilus assembly complex ATPase component TadA (plasmid) [Pseudomonas silvicola]|nr:Flp pilus assembly complex ATPase component TadA [Pseudomonas silvicola]WAH62283.1 Flp pilus assembly complex ATPase component TadA [Pseudomonas silvicola]
MSTVDSIFGDIPTSDVKAWNLVEHYFEPLKEFYLDETITEICVNRYDRIQVERKGRLQTVDARFPSERDLQEFIIQVGNRLNQPVDSDNPMLDARFPNGVRLSCTIPPVTPFGATMSMRCKPAKAFTMAELVGLGSLTEEMADYIAGRVQHRANMFVTGNTGAGKTALLRACAGFIDPSERVLTAEDTLELGLDQFLPDCVAFEAPHRRFKQNLEPITLASLIRKFLRYRPDRGWVGEIRDAAAADALFQFIYTGHSGTASSLHTNGPFQTVPRLQYLLSSAGLISFDLAGQMILDALDLMIHCSRDPRFGRKVTHIVDVREGVIVPVFEYDIDAGIHRRVAD